MHETLLQNKLQYLVDASGVQNAGKVYPTKRYYLNDITTFEVSTEGPSSEMILLYRLGSGWNF
jgi:hypothetical protein